MGALHQALLAYKTSAAGGGGLDPGSFLAGLDWFLDADTISGNDGDPVVDWLDSGPDGRHYGQNTSTNQPTLKKNLYNGHAAVRFATNDKLVPDPTSRGYGAANTLVLVCTPSSTANSYILSGNGSGGEPALLSGFSSKAFEYYNVGGAERSTFATSASGLHILTVARTDDAGNCIGYYDGVQVFSVAVNTGADWSGHDIPEIGANGPASGDDYYNGDIAMIIKFNQNHAGASGLDDLHDAIKAYFTIA
jgi:hypothetical protein